jgi:subtilisin-like proprotein convertase family protein
MINDFIKYDVKYVLNNLMGLNSNGTWKIEFADSSGNMSFGRCTTPIEMIHGVISNPQ